MAPAKGVPASLLTPLVSAAFHTHLDAGKSVREAILSALAEVAELAVSMGLESQFRAEMAYEGLEAECIDEAIRLASSRG